MKLVATPIAGVYEAETAAHDDVRGSFARLFCARELAQAQGERPVVQINRSVARRSGTIRGLHFQHPPHAEAKWVRCLRGRVWDVALDLRHGSVSFLEWHAVELSAETMNAIFIPEGFAHGFQTLEADSELLYLHTAFYSERHQGGVRWDDPRIAIPWPLAPADMSERDRALPLLDVAYEGIAT